MIKYAKIMGIILFLCRILKHLYLLFEKYA